jgi:hypothetical protein
MFQSVTPTKKGPATTCGDIRTFSGREGTINLEQLLPLAESIFENWCPESFDESLLVPVGAGVGHESFYKY